MIERAGDSGRSLLVLKGAGYVTTKTESNVKAKSEVKPFVYVAVGVAALGGLLFGYDTGVFSGAILFIKKQFSLSATMEEIVVSAVLVGL